jgi:hypothetical protein
MHRPCDGLRSEGQISQPQLGAGEMFDLLKQRDKAIQRYQALLASDESSDHAHLAQRSLKQPC